MSFILEAVVLCFWCNNFYDVDVINLCFWQILNIQSENVSSSIG